MCRPELGGPSSGPDEVDLAIEMDGRTRDGQPLLVAINIAPIRLVMVTGHGGPACHTIPIVFVIVPDPVGSGFVESLSQPGANATGFMMFEYNLCGKWLELLKEIAPSVTHAAVLRDAGTAAGVGQFAVIQSVAPSVGIDVSPIDLRGPAQIDRVIATFAQRPNGGMILSAGATGAANANLIIAAAARYKLPGIHSTAFCCCRRD